MQSRVRVWDLPTRLFHWALAACVVGLTISGWRGGDAMPWHARLGYAAATLLLFRIVWGFAGGRWSRFSAFVFSPRSVAAYLKGRAHPDHLVGHNPLGAISVLVMLLVLLAQVGTGLVGDDEISFTGPLNRFIESAHGLAATAYHKRIGQWLLVGLVALHVAAIAYYRVRKQERLVGAMIGGDKLMAQPVEPSRDDATTRAVALAVFAACAAAVAWVVSLGG